MLKKLAKTITSILMVISLSLTITPIYNTNAQNNNEGIEQYEETSYQLTYSPNYTGDAAWLNDFVLEEDPATAGKVILEKYVGTAEDLYIPSKVTIGTTEYDVSLCDSPEFFLNTGIAVTNDTTKSVTFAPDFDTSNVTDMSRMFYYCRALTTLDVSNFNTENVTNMNNMFCFCSSLTTLDLSNFNTENVTNMYDMFSYCKALTSLDVSSFNTANVTDMQGMFSNCEALSTLDVSNFNTANVTKMNRMFYYCHYLTTLDVSNFNTENVSNMYDMFSNCEALSTLDVSNFNTENVRNVNNMFYNCSSLANLNISSFDLGDLYQSANVLGGCNSLQTIKTPLNLHQDISLPYKFVAQDNPSVSFTYLPKNESSSQTIVKYIGATGITVAPTTRTLTVGDNFTITPTVAPANATDKSVTWSSSNPAVATVDTTGKVTALSSGTTTITATTNNGGYKATCTVTVSPVVINVTGITVIPTAYTMNAGEDYFINAVVTPVNATDQGITWSSSNPTIATVNEDGIVTALKAGIATITATTNDGGYKATCVITVNDVGGKVNGITVSPVIKTLAKGETFNITPTVTPEDAADKSVTWTTSDDTIATVDANGKVTALKEGTATITATTNDGGFKAACTVTVSATKIDVTGITVTPTTKTMNEGTDYHLTATVTPDDATDKSVTWSSSDDTIATVDANGKVTALKEGTATITATTNDGGFTASCIITVIKSEGRVTGITLTPISKTAHTGEVFFITPTITPVDAVDKSVTWSSSNPSIATVDSNGKVTALREGVVTITATTNDGGLKATCIVNVDNSGSTIDVYRLYNPYSSEHFFTNNNGERQYLASIGWNDEGVAWTAPSSSNIPVYRVFNPYTGEHHYTSNLDEKDYLTTLGWNDEGICWYSINYHTKGTPIYRVFYPYNSGIGAHHYTANTSERDYLITIGWNYEGIGWYGL